MIEQHLIEDKRNVLGSIEVVRPYRKGIQWYPADDLVVTCDLSLVSSDGAQDWFIDVEVNEVEPIGSIPM